MTGRSGGEAYWAGYQRGMEAGHRAGYAEGLAVLDDAAKALAELKPSKTVEVAAARERLAHYDGPSLTPTQIRVQAAESWGLPVPADLVEEVPPGPAQVDTAVPEQPEAEHVAELWDDDDWAWAL